MEFPTKTDEELERENLLPYGVYPAEILDAEERFDTKGRSFLMLKLGVYDDTREQHVWDNISANWPKMHFKFKHLFKSAGNLDQYEKGYVEPADMLHWQVAVLLDQEGPREYRNKDGEMKTSPAKNVVKDYVDRDAIPTAATKAEAAKPAGADPDLPF